MKRVTAQQASDFVLGSELERLGVFNRIDSQPFAAVEREVRIDLLGVGDRCKRKENPRHRPPGIDEPLKRDKIVQTVLFERAAHPEKQMKDAVGAAIAAHGVTKGYVYRCLKKITPERRNQMIESIIKARHMGEMLMLMYILASEPPQK